MLALVGATVTCVRRPQAAGSGRPSDLLRCAGDPYLHIGSLWVNVPLKAMAKAGVVVWCYCATACARLSVLVRPWSGHLLVLVGGCKEARVLGVMRVWTGYALDKARPFLAASGIGSWRWEMMTPGWRFFRF